VLVFDFSNLDNSGLLNLTGTTISLSNIQLNVQCWAGNPVSSNDDDDNSIPVTTPPVDNN
jgi:hypothetical protein